MKSLRFKRSLAFLMSVILTITSLSSDFTLLKAHAVGQEHSPVVSNTPNDYVDVTKRADVSGDEVTITFNVTNKSTEMPVDTAIATDVVFVMDLSGSMKGDRLTNAKTAAKKFVEELFKLDGGKGNVQVGIASFSTEANIEQGLTTVASRINDKIDDLSAEGGTNIQDGIRKAKAILDTDTRSSKEVKKIIVLLSDGAPTYSFKGTAYNSTQTRLNDGSLVNLLTAFDARVGCGSHYSIHNSNHNSASYVLSEAKTTGWYDANDKKYDTSKVSSKTNGDRSGSVGEVVDITFETVLRDVTYVAYRNALGDTWYYKDSYNVQHVISDETKITEKYKTEWYYASENRGKITVTEEVEVEGSRTVIPVAYHEQGSITVSNHGLATISEAQIAKDAKAKIDIYTIGYGISSQNNKDTDAKYVMKNVASSVDQFKLADDSEAAITSVLNEISTSIKEKIDLASGTKLTDTFPSYMTVTGVASAENKGTTTLTGNKVEWSLGDNTSGTLTITAKLDFDAMFAANGGADSFANGNYAKLNDNLVISYIKNGETTPTEDVSISDNNVPWGVFNSYKYSVTYYVDGESVSSNDGYTYAGKEVTIPNLEDYLTDTGVKYDKTQTKVTGATVKDAGYSFVMGAEEKNVVVNYYTKTYEVKYFKHTNTEDKVQVGNTQFVHYGANATPEAAPEKYTRNGFEYTFTSWNHSGENITRDTEIEAIYDNGTQVVFNVTFMVQNPETGVYEILGTSQQVNAGANATATESEVPDVTFGLDTGVDHKAFNGKWYTSSTCSDETLYDFDSVVNGDIVLYAGYSDVLKQYKVEYYHLNGSLIDVELNPEYNVTINYGDKIPNLHYKFGHYKNRSTSEITFFHGWKVCDEPMPSDGWFYASDDIAENGVIKAYAYGVTAPLYYTVSYCNADGALLKEYSVEYDGTVAYVGETPEKSGGAQFSYVFDHFDLVVGDTNYNKGQDGRLYNVSANYTLIARYTESVNQYTYGFQYYDANNRLQVVSKPEADYGTTYSVPDDFVTNIDVSANGVETKRTFVKWSDTEFETGITKNGVAVAQYDDETWYQVTFEYNGKTATTMVKSGESLSDVQIPTDTEKSADDMFTYEFVGWNKDTGAEITEPTTFVANYVGKYIPYDLEVKVIVGNAEPVVYNSAPVHLGEKAEYDFNIAEYNKDGMRYQIASVSGDITEIAADNKYSVVITKENKQPSITIVLVEEPKYSVIYHDAGLSADDVDAFKQIVNYSIENYELGRTEAVYAGVPFEAKTLTVDTVKNDKYTYKFDKWVTADGKEFVATTLAGDVHVYPSYKETVNEYTVTFRDGDNAPVVVSVPYGTTVPADKIPTLSTPEDTVDTHFTGTNNWGEFTEETVVYSNIVVDAFHSSEARKYKVVFKDYDGSDISSNDVAYGADASAPVEPVRDDDNRYSYKFAGWFENIDEDAEKVAFPKTVEDNITVYAKYTSEEHEYNVTFVDEKQKLFGTVKAVWSDNAKGFRVDYSQMTEMAKKEAASLTDWKHTYTFAGWSNSDKLSQNVTEDFAATASYNMDLNIYIVSYVDELGNKVYEDTSVSAGDPHTINSGIVKESTETKDFHFDKWVENTIKYSVGQVIEAIMSNHVFEASFTETDRLYDVTYYNGTEPFGDTVKATYNTPVAEVDRPEGTPKKASEEANGYVTEFTFDSWNFGNVTKIVSDTDAYAKYDSRKYPVDPVANPDKQVTVVGEDVTGNVFENDGTIPADTERKAVEVTDKAIVVDGETVGTITVKENGDYTIHFDKPVSAVTIPVDYVFTGTETNNDDTSDYSRELTTPVEVKVGAVKKINLSDLTTTYNNEAHTVKYVADPDIKITQWFIDGAAVREQPNRTNAGEYTVKAVGSYEFEGKTFTTESTANLVINKEVITVSLPTTMQVVATEFATEPDYSALSVTTGTLYGDVILKKDFKLDATAVSATSKRFIPNETPYKVTVNATISDTDNYELKTVDGALKVLANTDKKSVANFYVVLPGALDKLSKENVGLSESVVGQNSNNFSAKLFEAQFAYDFAPYKSLSEYFGSHKKLADNGVEYKVDKYFTENNSEKAYKADYTLTYQTKDAAGKPINTYELANIDWYVLKDYSTYNKKTEMAEGWHVDGYANSIKLVAKTFEGKTLEYTYNGKSLETAIADDIASYIKAESDKEVGGKFTVVADTYSKNIAAIKNANDTAEDVTVTVKYSDGIDETIDPTFTVTFPVKVNKAKVTVPEKTFTKTYDGEGYETTIEVKGQADEVLTFEVNCESSGAGNYTFVPGDKMNTVSVAPSESTVELLDNYDVTYSNVTVVINKKAIDVTVADATKVYGEEDPELTVGIEGLIESDSNISLGKFAYRSEQGEDVKSYKLAFNKDAANKELKNYEVTNVKVGNLTITKAPLYVVVNDGRKTYDGKATFTNISVKGFGSSSEANDGLRNNDKFNDIAKLIKMYRNGNEKDAGQYAGQLVVNVAASNRALKNYEIKDFEAGTLTIDKANLYVYPTNATKVYGDEDPRFTYTVVGLVNREKVSVVKDNIEVIRTSNAENVGLYVGVLQVVATENKNYNIIPYFGNFTITPANSLKATVENQVYTYDGTEQGEGVAVTGMKKDTDKITVLYTYMKDGKRVVSTEVPTFVNQGRYVVSYVAGDGEHLLVPNYVPVAGRYTVTVNRRELDVTANNQEYIYNGEAQGNGIVAETDIAGDELEIRYFVDGVEEGSDEVPTFTNAGTYNVTATVRDAAKEDNYVHYEVNYTVVVAAKKVVITIDNKAKTYGDADPELTSDVSGNIEGEVINYTLTRKAGLNVGEYTITAVLPEEDEVNANYDIEVEEGTFTINKRTAYVRMNDATKYVGDADPMFSASVSNTAYNDSIYVDPWRIAGEGAGTYAIHANVGENANYNIDFTPGTLTIVARQEEVIVPPVTPTRPTITPVTPTPTPVVEEEVVTPPAEEEIVEIAPEETPQAAAPETEEAPQVVIEEEPVPEAAATCWIHWLILALTLVYAIYASARAVQNKRELDDEKEVQEN